MSLTKKKKELVGKHVKNIVEMGMLELRDFDRHLQNAKSEIDSEVWKWVNKAVVAQTAHLMDIDLKTGGAMAVMSEIEED